MPAAMQTTTDMPITTQKPQLSPSNGTPVFIPQKAAIRLGMDTSSVMDASTFITTLRLLEMMEA